VWQLLSPIMGLLIVVVFKAIGVENLLKFSDKAIFIPFPSLFGLNMKSLSTIASNYLRVSTCNQWYMYEFDETVSQADRDFFGFNEGQPWDHLNSSGMLDGKHNVMSYTCNEINRTVPYFKEFQAERFHEEDMAMYLSNTIKSFASVNLDFGNRDASFPELDNLPDGAYRVRQANKRKLSYNLQLNDLKYW
jgi:hypothetical protein